MTALFTIVAASFAVCVAAWLVPASVEIVSWSRTTIGRVALFAPLYLFWVALLAGAGLAAVVWFVGPRTSDRRVGRARVIAPLAALWLWTIPFLPWAGDWFPVLLVLAGPLRWLIAAAAVFTSAWRWTRSRGWGSMPPLPGRKTVFALSLAIYLVLGFRSLSIVGLGGDEPHYLVITHSLLVDRDLQIENNHAREDYRAFFGGPLRPDYMQRGVNEQIYSIHAPGLPALLLPGYAAAGSRGALAIICLLAALTALAIFDVAARIGGTAVAWATWLSVCLTVPFIPHAWAIYPEIAGAALVAWTVAWATSSDRTPAGTWIARGLGLAALPWLHTKFVVFLAALTLWLLLRLRGKVKESLAFLAPIVVSGIAWLAFFYIIYGRLDPEAPYGGYTDQFVRIENIPRSILGILFDQKFGLFVYAPVYLLAAIGAWLLARDRQWRPLSVALVSTALLYAVGSARLYMWWGGSSAPARFLVPVVPLLAPMIAIALSRLRVLTAPANVWLVVILSALVSASGILGFERLLLFSDPHGSARILQQLQGSAPLTAALPTFTDENWTAPLAQLAPWLLGAVVAFAAARVMASRLRLPIFWVITIEATAFFIVAAMLSGPFAANVRADSVTRGRLALLTAFDPERLRAFDYATRSKVPPADWLNAGRLAIDLDPSQPADEQGRLTGPLVLPAGRYEVKVWFEGERPRDGDLILGPGRGQVLARLQGPLSNPAVVTLDVPVPIPQLWVQLTEVASAQVATRVELNPVSIVPASDRPRFDVRAVEAIPTRPNAYMVYIDDFTYPEGGVFWTRGTSLGEVLVVPEGAGQIDLTLHVGPVGGVVRLVVAGQSQDLDMKGDETRVVSVAVPLGALYVPVAVQATGTFQPSAVAPPSTDTRLLGCQVRVEVR